MASPALVDDVQKRFPRPLTSVEETYATTKLEDAWTDLQGQVPDLVDRLNAADADALRQQTIRILAQAVVRVLLNPYGRKQQSSGIDDAQGSWTVSDGLAAGELYFTDAELDSLRAKDPDALPVVRGKAFSVMPS